MRLVLTESIAAPIGVVYQVYTDLRRAPVIVSSIHSVDIVGSGPIGKGTRFRETRSIGGKETTSDMVVTEFDPKRSLTIEGEVGGHALRTAYVFTSSGGRTQVEMTRTATPTSLGARLSSFLEKGAVKAQLERDQAELAAACVEQAKRKEKDAR
ncbi:MAG: SRPBCC family protein [Planctomycetota bacterium]